MNNTTMAINWHEGDSPPQNGYYFVHLKSTAFINPPFLVAEYNKQAPLPQQVWIFHGSGSPFQRQLGGEVIRWHEINELLPKPKEEK